MKELGEAKETCENYLTHILGATNKDIKIDSDDTGDSADRIREIWASEKHYESNGASALFQPNISQSAQLGPNGAEIKSVFIRAENGSEVRTLKGGEIITLSIHAVAYNPLKSPIIGFFVKDRLGQYLFGSNTLNMRNSLPQHVDAGQALTASFTFAIPWLAQGDYSIQVALADGDQRDHAQHHWIHDAVIFHSSNDASASGLIGIPMLEIQLKIDN